MLLDIDYILLGMPAIVISLWAQWRIVSACSAAGRLPASSGLTGAQAARLPDAGQRGGTGGDHAGGRPALQSLRSGRKVLRLSQSVHAGRSLASLGIAAHEAGHAIQQASRSQG